MTAWAAPTRLTRPILASPTTSSSSRAAPSSMTTSRTGFCSTAPEGFLPVGDRIGPIQDSTTVEEVFRMLDIILTLAQRFRAQGYELYMVGGTVRDLLLRRDVPADADLATNARPDDIKRIAAAHQPAAVGSVGQQ